jgi:hypothetical protein
VTRLAPRAALVALAAIAVLWFGYGLRALELESDADRKVEGAGALEDPAAIRDARSLLHRAARYNADPTPELDEARLLIRLGRQREAVPLLESVVRSNPGSIAGWALLATATAPLDDRRSTEANGELLKLYGRAHGQPLALGSIRASTGRRYTVTPGSMEGFVDWSSVRGDIVAMAGWAVDRGHRVPAEAVMVVSHGDVVATFRPRGRRADIARDRGAWALRSGFEILVRRRQLIDDEGDLDVHVFAAARGRAAPIGLHCSSGRMDIGC